MGSSRRRPGSPMSAPGAPVGLFRGDDTYAIERAVDRLAADLGEPGPPLQRWRLDPAAEAGTGLVRALASIAEHVGMAPLFGGGQLVVVGAVAMLTRERTARDRLIALVGEVPAGNGLALLDVREGATRRSAAADPLADAVRAAGGTVALFPALTRERMSGWLVERAVELSVRLGPGAAQALTERVGAQVREGDVDRRHQRMLANAELEKLALYRPGGTISRDDVAALVPETVPGSAWAFLDAVGARQVGVAATLAERLMAEGTPLQVLVVRLHARLRELVIAAEHLASGARPADLVRAMGLQPYRAERLAEQAAAWSAAELEAALVGLLDVDLTGKGIGPEGGPAPSSDERSRLALDVWLAERVARRAASLTRAGGESVGA